MAMLFFVKIFTIVFCFDQYSVENKRKNKQKNIKKKQQGETNQII